MALARFPAAFDAAAAAVIHLAALLRAIRDQSGDLTMMQIDQVQDGLRHAKVAGIEALTEAQKAPQAAEALMASMGGPADLQGYLQAMGAIEAAAAAWNAALEAALQSMPATELVRLVTVGAEPAQTRWVEFARYLPAALADPLRQSEALAALIAALEAAGA